MAVVAAELPALDALEAVVAPAPLLLLLLGRLLVAGDPEGHEDVDCPREVLPLHRLEVPRWLLLAAEELDHHLPWRCFWVLGGESLKLLGGNLSSYNVKR